MTIKELIDFANENHINMLSFTYGLETYEDTPPRIRMFKGGAGQERILSESDISHLPEILEEMNMEIDNHAAYYKFEEEERKRGKKSDKKWRHKR